MGISDKLKNAIPKHSSKNDYQFEDNQLRPNKHTDGTMYSAPTGSAVAPPVQPVQDDYQQQSYNQSGNRHDNFNQSYAHDNYVPPQPARHDFVDGRVVPHRDTVQNDPDYSAPTGTAVPDRRDNRLNVPFQNTHSVDDRHNTIDQSFQNLNVNDNHVPPTGTAVHHGHHHGPHHKPTEALQPTPPGDSTIYDHGHPGTAPLGHSERPAPTPRNTENHLGHIAPSGTHVAHDGRNSPQLGYIPPSGTAVKLVPAQTADGMIKEDHSVPAPIDQTIGAGGHTDHHIGFAPKVMHTCHNCGADNDISRYFRKEAVYRIS